MKDQTIRRGVAPWKASVERRIEFARFVGGFQFQERARGGKLIAVTVAVEGKLVFLVQKLTTANSSSVSFSSMSVAL